LCELRHGPEFPKFRGKIGMGPGEAVHIHRPAGALIVGQTVDQFRESAIAIGRHGFHSQILASRAASAAGFLNLFR
jgi:hypothetical protein